MLSPCHKRQMREIYRNKIYRGQHLQKEKTEAYNLYFEELLLATTHCIYIYIVYIEGIEELKNALKILSIWNYWMNPFCADFFPFLRWKVNFRGKRIRRTAHLFFIFYKLYKLKLYIYYHSIDWFSQYLFYLFFYFFFIYFYFFFVFSLQSKDT